jgi:hypothetical protein
MRRLIPTGRRSCVRAGILALVATSALLTASRVRAQSSDIQRTAAVLFTEARRQMAEGRFEDACPRLARSVTLDPEVGTQMNLAHCYELLGRTASAWSTWKAAAEAAAAKSAIAQDETDRRKQTDREAFARARMVDLEPHLLYVTLQVVNGGTARPDVRLDGDVVASERWGMQTPVDPGMHSVAAQAPGRQSWFAQFEVAEQRAPRVSVVIPALVATPIAEQAPPRGATNGRGWMRSAAIGVASASVGLGAVGAVFGLAAIQAHDRAAKECAFCADQRNLDLHQLDGEATTSDIAFAAAGVGVIVAVIFWCAAPHPASDRLAVHPLLGPREAALLLSEPW